MLSHGGVLLIQGFTNSTTVDVLNKDKVQMKIIDEIKSEKGKHEVVKSRP